MMTDFLHLVMTLTYILASKKKKKSPLQAANNTINQLVCNIGAVNLSPF